MGGRVFVRAREQTMKILRDALQQRRPVGAPASLSLLSALKKRGIDMGGGA